MRGVECIFQKWNCNVLHTFKEKRVFSSCVLSWQPHCLSFKILLTKLSTYKWVKDIQNNFCKILFLHFFWANIQISIFYCKCFLQIFVNILAFAILLIYVSAFCAKREKISQVDRVVFVTWKVIHRNYNIAYL